MADDETTETKRPGAGPAPAAPDLSEELSKSLDRKSDERVKVVRVFSNYYRCNWWVQDTTPHPFWLATGTIRKSRFIRVGKSKDGGLLVEDAR